MKIHHMKKQHLITGLVIILLLAAMLAFRSTIAYSSPLQGEGERSGVFGEVVQIDEDAIVVNVGGKSVRIQLSPDSRFIGTGQGNGSLNIQPGDRVAVMVVDEDGTVVAESVMVIPQRANMVHIMGVVGQSADDGVTIITDEGQHLIIKLFSDIPIPAPGTVVTVVGQRDPITGIIQARSFHQLNDTLQRLSNHLDTLETDVPNDQAQIAHLARIRHLIERTSRRQIEILSNVIEQLPEEARPALERAVRNLEEANQAVLRAFSQALEKVGIIDRVAEISIEDDLDEHYIPPEIPFSREDLAKILGLEPLELSARFQQGKSLLQIAEEHGLTPERLEEAIMRLVRERAASLIEKGHLTADEAKRLTEQFREKMLKLILEALHTDRQYDAAPDFPISPEDAAQILGIPLKEMIRHFEEGGTFKQLIQRRGLSVESVIERMLNLARQRLATLVEEGRITPQELVEHLERMTQELFQELARTPEDLIVESRPIQVVPINIPFNLDAVARILDLSPDTLLRLLYEGNSVEQIAKERNIFLDKLINALLAPMEEHLGYLLKEERIIEEQARRMYDEMRQGLLRALREFHLPEYQEFNLEGGVIEPSLGLSTNVPITLVDVARVLGIELAEIQRLFETDESLLPLLKARGIGVEEFVRVIIDLARQRLNTTEEGRDLTREQIENILVELKHRLLPEVQVFEADSLTQIVGDSGPDTAGFALPSISSPSEFFQALGIDAETVRKLHGEGLTVAEIARELGLTPSNTLERLVVTAKQRMLAAIQERLLSEEEAAKRLAHFESLVRDWVDFIFAKNEVSSEKPQLIDILPRLSTADDIFRVLGVAEKAIELRERGLSLANVARELGFGPDLMYNRLLDIGEGHVVTAIRSGTLSEEEGKDFLTLFKNTVGDWVEFIFAGSSAVEADTLDSTTVEEPLTTSATESDSSTTEADTLVDSTEESKSTEEEETSPSA